MIIEQNIAEITNGIIAHGVNCQGVMGAGVAKAIYSKYPVVKHQFKYRGKVGKEALGLVDWVKIYHKQLYVANCYTQEFYGRNGVYADINAIKDALSTVCERAQHRNYQVYIPKIGCGLAGLSWENDVCPIVKEVNKIYKNKIKVCVQT